eukprot:GILJ01008789.1.p1 GENE.GILJ01008789.1~~GILJ01008789.1.p1  ORF type:complete len:103 (+),score=5.07 GILJ01008789.1:194-502(+)
MRLPCVTGMFGQIISCVSMDRSLILMVFHFAVWTSNALRLELANYKGTDAAVLEAQQLGRNGHIVLPSRTTYIHLFACVTFFAIRTHGKYSIKDIQFCPFVI